jgi:hypothetical protein
VEEPTDLEQVSINPFAASVSAITQAIQAASCPPPPRLAFDPLTLTVTLDGIPHAVPDPDAYAAISILHEEGAYGAGRPLSGKRHLERIGRGGDESTLRRWIKSLPPALRALIKGKRGSGRWLQLPPVP